MRVVLHTVALAMACSSVRVHAAETSAERNHGRVLHASEMSRLRGRDDLSLARSLLEGQAAAARGEAAPPAPFASWAGDSAAVNDADPLHQVSDFIARQDDERAAALVARASGEMSLLEVDATSGTGADKVHAFCEICILVMQMKERGQPHLCAGLNPDYFISCVENLESLLRADKAVTYWLRSGCMHLDREGPEIVKPCPAHAICAWVPNLFEDVGIVTPRNELAPMCPRDFKYLPRIPRKQAVE